MPAAPRGGSPLHQSQRAENDGQNAPGRLERPHKVGAHTTPTAATIDGQRRVCGTWSWAQRSPHLPAATPQRFGTHLYNNSKSRLAAERSRERRKAEDDAPRLTAEVPLLRSARIEIVDNSANGSNKYSKHVVVARSPALFIVPCSDPACRDGDHDITSEVMHAFRQQLESLVGESSCRGMTGSAECRRSIQFTLTAEYAKAAPR